MGARAAAVLLAALMAVAGCEASALRGTEGDAKAALEKIGVRKGICVVLGLPRGDEGAFVTALAQESELLIYVQLSEAGELAKLREATDTAGLLGRRVYVAKGAPERVHLADNLADAVLVYSDANVREAELLRALRPGGKALVRGKVIVRPSPKGTDDWSHPYHGPDNNPQSKDEVARAPYLTQFFARPVFGCQPCVTVAAGGRVFRAFGHMAFKSYQNEVLQTLWATNAYNGTLLWKRKLTPGFMIHRNTMIATPESLYIADDTSCKRIDAATGEIKGEIAPPTDLAGGTVWKWMALEKGTLYALMGAEEIKAMRRPGQSPTFGGWPWGMWRGYDYKGGERAWGFGRSFLAIEPETGKVLWNHREEELVDSRAVCMRGGRIFFYSPGKSLGCLDAARGKLLWRSADPELLEAIGQDGRAQFPRTGFTPTTYVKCDDRFLFFAGPQRPRLVTVLTDDGKLLWQKTDTGNYQLVLRPDALYAAGPNSNRPTSLKLAYETGEVLGNFIWRHNCTRATGSIDSIFYRGPNGTVRYVPATAVAEHIAPVRPPCQDGVIIADGLLHWGPWICGCRNSIWGDICLGPAGDFDYKRKADESRQLEVFAADLTKVERLNENPNDWLAFRRDSGRSGATPTALPKTLETKWSWKPEGTTIATAPVAAGGLVFVGDTDGVVRALKADDGKPVWKAYTEGAIYYPPTIWEGRAYVGSNDGYVYAFETATGRQLWRFRVAPVERRMPLFGTIVSTWPVAGGVVVEEGVVYAAAGIAHFDGTHVCALDAVTGKIRWHNNSSGILHRELRNGISLQGNVRLTDGRLEFPGGNAYPTASFDAKTGKCLNKPGNQWGHTRDLFHPRDAWNLQHNLVTTGTIRAPAGTVAILRRKLQGGRLGPPRLTFTPTEAAEKAGFEKWERPSPLSCRGLVCAADTLLVLTGSRGESTLAATRLKDGEPLWSRKLPGLAVGWGVAIDGAGRIYVSLEDGRVLCLAAAEPVPA